MFKDILSSVELNNIIGIQENRLCIEAKRIIIRNLL